MTARSKLLLAGFALASFALTPSAAAQGCPDNEDEYEVSGAGTTAANGIYVFVGFINSQCAYQIESGQDYYLYYSREDTDNAYVIDEDGTNPNTILYIKQKSVAPEVPDTDPAGNYGLLPPPFEAFSTGEAPYPTVGLVGVLPVELVAFDALADGPAVELRWRTATEKDNAGFEVEHRPAEAEAFEALEFVPGAGTTREARTYAHRVDGLTPGRHVFRLRQVDHDGGARYSPEVEIVVGLPAAFVAEPAYPNPFNPQTTVRFAVQQQQAVRAELHDAMGRTLRVLYDGMPEAGRLHEVRIDGSGLPSGIYFVRFVGEGLHTSQQITLLK